MRKLIVALVVLGLVAAASVWEIVWLERTFDTAIEMLEKVDDAVSADVENVNNAPAMRSMNELIDWWEDRRTLVMGLLNHAQVKNIDDRFVDRPPARGQRRHGRGHHRAHHDAADGGSVLRRDPPALPICSDSSACR